MTTAWRWEYRRYDPRTERLVESDTPNRYRASKQADTLMLGHLFRPAELASLFTRLGYPFDDGLWRRTVDHYLRRTCHGSTLSSLVHGWILARQQGPDAWRHCQEALLSDITDAQGGTTGEGIHLGAMSGTLCLVERGIVGLEPHGDGLRIDPVPLSQVPGSSFSISYLGHRDIRIRFRPGRLGSASASPRRSWARCPWSCPEAGTNAFPQARSDGSDYQGADATGGRYRRIGSRMCGAEAVPSHVAARSRCTHCGCISRWER
ncbi:hypothetical protein ACWGCK_07195 [Streptomyces virginiae]